MLFKYNTTYFKILNILLLKNKMKNIFRSCSTSQVNFSLFSNVIHQNPSLLKMLGIKFTGLVIATIVVAVIVNHHVWRQTGVNNG